MQRTQAYNATRTEYAPVPDTLGGRSAVLSVELADDEEVRWQWTHYPNGQSVVTGYDIVKKREEQGDSQSDL